MSHNDASFFKTFGIVLGALVLFTLFIGVVANIYSPPSDRSSDPLVLKEQAQQIAPIGKSRVAQAPAAQPQPVVKQVEETVAQPEEAPAADQAESEETAVAEEAEPADTETVAVVSEPAETTVAAVTQPVVSTATSAVASDIPVRVKAVVATNCAGCHQDGLYGAQRSDDAAAWSALSEKGLETLTASVINGKGAMLARAETSLTDEEISLAVSHMIAQATGGGAQSSSSVASTTATATETAAVTAGTATAETTQVAEEETPVVEEETQVAKEETPVAESESAEATVAAAPTVEIPANVKAVVDGLCAGCHISGVANAPKYGDKAAWDQRMAMGMDKLLASAIAGKGAMPARGGSQLSDAELRLAIEYMAAK